MRTSDSDFVDFIETRCSSAISKLQFDDRYSKFNNDFNNAKEEIYNISPRDIDMPLFNLIANLEEKHAIENAICYKCGLVDGIETKFKTL